MKFLEGTPVFAVEVRSEEDYGANAERRLAAKHDDYFAAGTLCVWDVDLLSPDAIKVYHAADPDTPIIFRRGAQRTRAKPPPAGQCRWTTSCLKMNRNR